MMLKNFGEWVYRNKWKTIVAWLVVLILFILGVGKLGAHFTSNLKIDGLPSTDIQSKLEKEFHQNPNAGTMKVVIQSHEAHGVQNADIKRKIVAAVHDVKTNQNSSVKTITNPYDTNIISKDKTTTYVDVTFKKDAKAVTQSQIKKVENVFNDKVKGVRNAKVAYTGTVEITPFNVGGTSELIGIVIAFILLLLLFRSFITAGLPIISALVGLLSGTLLITLGTHIWTLVNFAQTLSTMLALAVGIDYALFIVHRYRSERDHGEPAEALGIALQTAGSSVLFAGMTVIVAIAGLSIVGIAFLTQMAVAAAVGVALAILSALTFLPALIAVLSKWIKPESKDAQKPVTKPGCFSIPIVKHPLISTIVAVLILLGCAMPAKNMRLGMPYNGSMPKDNTERQAYDMISDKFGEGINAPLIGVVKLNQDQSKATQKRNLQKITNHVKNLDGVKMIVPVVNEKLAQQVKTPQYQAAMKQKLTKEVKAKTQVEVMAMIKKDPALASQQQALAQKVGAKIAKQAEARAQASIKSKIVAKIPAQISKDYRYAYFVLIPKKGTAAVQTERLTHQINQYSNHVQKQQGTKITLTGINAINIDITNKLNNAIPIFAGTVIVLAFILLMLMFKSFLIPLFAMVGFGLSLLASFGLTTLTMQEGFMKGFLGISKGAPILSFLPVIFIGILFGLAMDYEVFMVSRAREEYLRTGDNDHAVLVALKTSGPVIVTAALIMIAVFGSFSLSTNPTVKSLGLSLAFGIFFDAFLVRLILVPAMIKICGKANWSFPGNRKVQQNHKK